jgi:hypothetical protein
MQFSQRKFLGVSTFKLNKEVGSSAMNKTLSEPALCAVQPAVVHNESSIYGEIRPVVGAGAEGISPSGLDLETALECHSKAISRGASNCLLELILSLKVDLWYVCLANEVKVFNIWHCSKPLIGAVHFHEPLARHKAVVCGESPLPATQMGPLIVSDSAHGLTQL